MSRTTVPLLLETIKVEDGTVFNLHYHQKRCNTSRQKLYQSDDILDLSSVLSPPKKGLYRCRVIYAAKIKSIEYIPYAPKIISKFKIVSSELSYDLKYANRISLDTLLLTHQDVDEVIIEKDGYITDTTFSNIAFYDSKEWVTPSQPLVHGTMRQKLIDEGLLQPKIIKKDDIKNYTNVALINAMIGFKILNDFTIE